MSTKWRMTRNHARAERAALCDLLAALGPNAPTLCAGWTSRDLAAHLVLRERRPLAAPGITLRRLSGYTERVRRRLARRPLPDLIELLRRPPRWSPFALDRVDRAVNTLEMFIHHEDLRRGQPDSTPRPLPPDLAGTLWTWIRRYARWRLRRFPATVTIHAPGHGELRTGAGGEPVELRADPGELALFLTGRRAASQVTFSGPDELAPSLRL